MILLDYTCIFGIILLKGADKVKSRIKYGTNVDKNLVGKFIQLSKDTRIPQSKLMDEALEMLLTKYNIKIEQK